MASMGRAWPRIASTAAILAVAAVAGLISYSHIYELTIALHQTVMVGRLMPFGVDGLIMIGSTVLLQAGAGQRWLGWLGVGPGVAISLFANIESGIRYGWLSATWAGIPAVSFFLACFILENWIKAQGKAAAHPQDVPEAKSAVPGDIQENVSPESVSAPTGVPAAAVTIAAVDAPRGATTAPVRPRQPKASGGDMEKRATRLLARQPGMSGAELGRALGASPRTGQRILAKIGVAA